MKKINSKSVTLKSYPLIIVFNKLVLEDEVVKSYIKQRTMIGMKFLNEDISNKQKNAETTERNYKL